MKIVCLFLINSLVCFCQTPTISWQKTYGGSGNDLATSIIQTSSGGYIIAGASNSPISGDKTQSYMNFSLTDFWVINTSNSGNIIWQKAIANSDSMNELNKVIVSKKGNNGYLVSGTFMGLDTHMISQNLIDNSGNFSSSGYSGDRERCLINSSGYGTELVNSFYATNGKNVSGGTHIGISTANCDQTPNFYIEKRNEINNLTTNFLWNKFIGGSENDYLRSFIETNDGGYALLGTSNSLISGDKTENAIGSYDFWILKCDGNGEVVWQNTIGGQEFEEASSIIETSDGGFLIGGTSNSYVSGDKSENSRGGLDYWIVKLNPDGNVVWDKTIGGSDDDILIKIKQTQDGNYILLGTSISIISGDKTDVNKGGKDIWIVKINDFGTIVWDKTIGGSMDDVASDLLQTNDGGYLVSSYSKSNISGDKTDNSKGFFDYWLLKLAPENLSTDNINLKNFSLYPNPSNGIVNIEFGKKYDEIKVSIINSIGQILSTKTVINSNDTILNINKSIGIYFVKIEDNKGNNRVYKIALK